MDNFKVMYKILALLDKHKGDENFDYALLSAGALKVDYAPWEQLMIELQTNGYIRGIVVVQTLSDRFPHIAEPIRPQITLKGMEYLAENGMMAKARNLLMLAGDII